MTMLPPSDQIAKYRQRRLIKTCQYRLDGILTLTEFIAAVLGALAEAPERAALWAVVPEPLRKEVVGFLAKVGPAGVPRAYVIGVNDPAWQAAQTARWQAVATELLERAAGG